MRNLATRYMQLLHQKLQAFNLRLFIFVAISVCLLQHTNTQIPYTRYMSELRIQELHTMAKRLQQSVDPEKYACDSFYDYVCGNHVPLYSILGNMLHLEDMIDLQAELENDAEKFSAKQKMLNFFISCNTRKNIEQCYRQTFIYFKPLYGYIITKNYLDGGAHEHQSFLNVLDRFLTKSEYTENFRYNPIRGKLVELRREFDSPHSYFRRNYVDEQYRDLKIYRESYEQNVRNLEIYRRTNMTYDQGTPKTLLDWSLYAYQSRNKPMAYYYATFTPHLWMALYNTTERFRRPLYFQQIGECLNLPQFVNMLEESRIMALIYLKSVRNSYQDYNDWIKISYVNQDINNHENEILRRYQLDDKKLFFTIYAQNFCDFGKELAESVFYLGLDDIKDFRNVYNCASNKRINDCHIL